MKMRLVGLAFVGALTAATIAPGVAVAKGKPAEPGCRGQHMSELAHAFAAGGGPAELNRTLGPGAPSWYVAWDFAEHCVEDHSG